MSPYSDHNTIGMFQAANNANGTYVPPTPATGNPYYQARFDGVQGYTHHPDNTQAPFVAPQQAGAGGAQIPDHALLGRPPRGAEGVAESRHTDSAAVWGCHCAGTSSAQGVCDAGGSDAGGMQWGSHVQQLQAVQAGGLRARGPQRQGFAVGEAGPGPRRLGNPGDMQQQYVYTPGDVAMVPQAHGAGRRRKNISVEDYVGASSRLADEWEDPAFSYGPGPQAGTPQAGTPQAGTGGIRHEFQESTALQRDPLLGPNDLVR